MAFPPSAELAHGTANHAAVDSAGAAGLQSGHVTQARKHDCPSLVVVDGGELIGVLSMRDIVRCWVTEGATSEMPGPAAEVSG
jgi:hypothetical protein